MCDSTSGDNTFDSRKSYTSPNQDKRENRPTGSQGQRQQSQNEITSTAETNTVSGNSSTAITGTLAGHKRTADEDVDLTKVHSANAWEQAEMGDDDRKKKFLKLMGAGKKNHSGKIVIGETTKSTSKTGDGSTKNLSDDLEQQYTHSLEHKLMGVKRHRGLGFHGDGKTHQEENASDAVITKDEELNIVASAAARNEGTATSTESDTSKSAEDAPTSQSGDHVKKMTFVKASS